MVIVKGGADVSVRLGDVFTPEVVSVIVMIGVVSTDWRLVDNAETMYEITYLWITTDFVPVLATLMLLYANNH